jgi:hypothetical protein
VLDLQAAEMGLRLGEISHKHPAVAKTNLYFVAFTARLKSHTDASGLFAEFFAACKVVP